jgi:NAD(P)-dependent dehydrogenase (short-subunit alcohol dehydrogenase family)
MTQKSTGSFAMKTVFITGAGAGIGQATARLFAKNNWFVGLYDRDEAAVHTLAQELGTDRAMAGRLDVSSVEDWQNSLAEFFEHTGRLDVLVNNAGILYSGKFENIPLENHRRQIDINVQGVINGCHTAFQYLHKTPNSRVINLSSASAIFGQPDLVTYAATKFAIRGLTEGLNIEWKAHGITVLDIMPMFVSTAMVTNMDANSFRKMGAKLTPLDVAKTVYTAATKRNMPIHNPVGISTKVFMAVASVMPDRLNVLINSTLSK